MRNFSQWQYTQPDPAILIGYAVSVGNGDSPPPQGRDVCSPKKTFCFYFSEVWIWKSESLLGLLSPWLITFVQSGKNANLGAASEFWLREWVGQDHNLETELGWIHNVIQWKSPVWGQGARLSWGLRSAGHEGPPAPATKIIANTHPMCLRVNYFVLLPLVFWVWLGLPLGRTILRRRWQLSAQQPTRIAAGGWVHICPSWSLGSLAAQPHEDSRGSDTSWSWATPHPQSCLH